MKMMKSNGMQQEVAQLTQAKASNGGYTFADAEAMKISARNPFPASRNINFTITISNNLTSGSGLVSLLNNPISVLELGNTRTTNVTYDAVSKGSVLDVTSSFPGGITGLRGWLQTGYVIDVNRILYTAPLTTQFSQEFVIARLAGIPEGTIKKNISAKVASSAGPQVFQNLRLEVPVSLEISSVTDLLLSIINPASGTTTTILNFFGKYAGPASII